MNITVHHLNSVNKQLFIGPVGTDGIIVNFTTYVKSESVTMPMATLLSVFRGQDIVTGTIYGESAIKFIKIMESTEVTADEKALLAGGCEVIKTEYLA